MKSIFKLNKEYEETGRTILVRHGVHKGNNEKVN